MEHANQVPEKILNSALALYSKYGIKSITMADLCRELGISKKTLYRHVRDKNDLLRKVIDYEVGFQRESTQKLYASGMNAIDELMHVNRHIHASEQIHSPTFYYDLRKYHPEIYNDWIEYKRNRMRELIVRNLEKGISERLYREDLDPDIIAILHISRVEMLHSADYLGDDELSSVRFIDEVFNYHIHGICNQVGLSYFNRKKAEQENNES